jgi:hypothetical protein
MLALTKIRTEGTKEHRLVDIEGYSGSLLETGQSTEEKLTGLELFRKFEVIMNPEGSLSCLEEPAISANTYQY